VHLFFVYFHNSISIKLLPNGLRYLVVGGR